MGVTIVPRDAEKRPTTTIRSRLAGGGVSLSRSIWRCLSPSNEFLTRTAPEGSIHKASPAWARPLVWQYALATPSLQSERAAHDVAGLRSGSGYSCSGPLEIVPVWSSDTPTSGPWETVFGEDRAARVQASSSLYARMQQIRQWFPAKRESKGLLGEVMAQRVHSAEPRRHEKPWRYACARNFSFE
jgi:hypothetical protein